MASTDDSVLIRIRRILSLDDSDRHPLALLAPIFAVTAASAIILSSSSKALFLAANDLSLLPWMFIGSALFTALLSIVYVAGIQRAPLETRFPILLGVALVSFAMLRMAYPTNPRLLSLLMFIWLPGMGYIIALQAWNMAAYLLPVRQGKRLFPVLAATATLGAAVGGGMVKLLLAWSSAEDLIWLAAVLLLILLTTVRFSIRRLRSARAGEGDSGPAGGQSDHRKSRPARQPGFGVAAGFRSVFRHPLLWRLAVFVFCLQAASVLVDYQFSGELKNQFSKDGIASFLGSFYLVSNGVVVVVSLFVTRTVVRLLGIGLALSAVAIFVGLGSSLYIVAAAGAFSTFWTLSTTALSLHVGQYALTRNSTQLLVAPLEIEDGERARVIIDGVVYRLATIQAAVVLLVMAPQVEGLQAFSPPVIIMCVVVVLLGVRIGPHYRRTLFDALRSRSVADDMTRTLGGYVVDRAMKEAEARLTADDPDEACCALDVASELKLPIRPDVLEKLARSNDERVAEKALSTMKTHKQTPSRELMTGLLQKGRSSGVLKEALHILNQSADRSFLETIKPLSHHSDPTVASLASMYRIRATQEHGTAAFERSLPTGEWGGDDPEDDVKISLVSHRKAVDYARDLLAMVDDDSTDVRAEAVRAMGGLRLPSFFGPLVSSLGDRHLRQSALDSLEKIGPAILSQAESRLEDEALPIGTRGALYTVLARIGTLEALELLRKQAGSDSLAIRNEAVTAIWRLARDPEAERPGRDWLTLQISEEIDRLKRYAAIEKALGPTGLYRSLFYSELDAARIQAETRVFFLLGIIYDRAALYRAYLHYCSPVNRVRSNAIELLDQHVRDPALKDFVGLVEQNISGDGGERLRTVMYRRHLPTGPIDDLIAASEPWLKSLWAWVTRREASDLKKLGWEDEIDRVFFLKQISLFSDMSGEQLFPIASRCKLVKLAAGETLFEKGEKAGELYLVHEGTIEIVRGGTAVATFRPRDVLGEIAILDGLPRSSAARAGGDASVVEVARSEFLDVLQVHPSLGRRVIEMLAGRIRGLYEKKGG